MNIKTSLLCGLLIICWANGSSIEELTKGNNIFTRSIYKEIIKAKQGNILVSPFSVEIILALSQSGARNQTAEEIRTALHLPNTDQEIQQIFKNVLPALTGDSKFTLHTANKIYVKDSFTLQDQFKKTANEVYQADAENINFTRKTEAANSMNKWVENQTDKKILKLIDPEILDENTAAVLINALLFKGQWVDGFWSQYTEKRKFYKTVEDSVEVDMMYQLPDFRKYYADKELKAQFLEMPFVGQDISMVFALPNEKDGIATLEKQIDKVFAPHDFREEFFEICIPKFKIEDVINLKDILQNLGIKLAFDELRADFGGVINESKKIYISHIMQKTYINVDEKGVEAAAGTFQTISFSMGPIINFTADHPFIFYIKFKDLILFAGRVSVPEL